MSSAADSPNPDSSRPAAGGARPADPRAALRGFLLLDLGVRVFIWSAAFALTCAAFTWFGLWPTSGPVNADLARAWHWAGRLTWWVILYNVVYVAILLVLRLPCPVPREGYYRTSGGAPPDRQLLWSCLLAVLTKARLQAPFPGFLVFHVAHLPPMCWLVNLVFGPRSESVNIAEPNILDPHLVTLGRNVVIGFGATVTGHVQDRDGVRFQRTIIEDDVLIGGHSVIPGGAHIKRGAMVGACAMLLPGTVIGENEFWAGIPAKKVRDLPPIGSTGTPDASDPRSATGGR